MMLTQNRKILVSVVDTIGIGFSVLVGTSLALTYQPPNMMSQQFSMNSNFPNIGFSGSQFNNMMSNSGQGFGGIIIVSCAIIGLLSGGGFLVGSLLGFVSGIIAITVKVG